MIRRVAIALWSATALATLAQAQIRGSGGMTSPVRITSGVSLSASSQNGGILRERFGARHLSHSAIFLGSPYYYADDSVQPALPLMPQVIVVQVPQTVATEPAKETKVEPLLIEWQGDRYVSMNKDGIAKRAPSALANHGETRNEKATALPSIPHSQPASADIVLIFRDGHREEIREYTIADNMLYTRNEDWSEGRWTRKIQLSALNLSATQAANQARGAQFLLPTGPNQVIASF